MKYINITMEVWGGGRKGRRMAAIAQTFSSAKEQQKGSGAALIHMRLQEALDALHILQGGMYCAPAQTGDREWVGIQLSVVLSLFSLQAFEQLPAINKHAQRSNRLREVRALPRNLGGGELQYEHFLTYFFGKEAIPNARLPKALGMPRDDIMGPWRGQHLPQCREV